MNLLWGRDGLGIWDEWFSSFLGGSGRGRGIELGGGTVGEEKEGGEEGGEERRKRKWGEEVGGWREEIEWGKGAREVWRDEGGSLFESGAL